jgi:predicted acyltransferase
MFFLVGAGDVLRRLFAGFGLDPDNGILYQLSHADWIGFTAWDIIMPLFLFTSGLSMPFSFGKFGNGEDKKGLYAKIAKRFGLLFLLGWIAQGNLLDLDPSRFHIYCNTLHAIAFGYLITALITLNARSFPGQVAWAVGLLAGYWLCMTFIPVPGVGSGRLTPDGNLAIYIDHALLGRFDDGTQYTWVITSLSFAATVMSGYLAGRLLQSGMSNRRKPAIIAVTGLALIAAGLLLGLQMPIIKKIWSCSMVLLSSGICFLLLALSFLLTETMGLRGCWVTWLRVFGLNSIAAYILYTTFGLGSIARRLLRGFEGPAGVFFPFVVALGEFAILWLILREMYRRGVFLKV